jgi:8-oxo-dGTP pyrophosphatase MutT (NUDIX family)
VELIHEIRKRIRAGALAGGSNDFSGYKRISASEARSIENNIRESAVLFPIYLRNGLWTTAFIRRTESTGVHSGQLSFPGGKIEFNESSISAAIRETEEEIGVKADEIAVECGLSEIYIPPSRFIVSPYIGQIPENPIFYPNPSEVDEVIEFPINELLKDNIIRKSEVFVKMLDRKIEVDCFDIHGNILWGATAMIVQEFRTALGFSG